MRESAGVSSGTTGRIANGIYEGRELLGASGQSMIVIMPICGCI